MNVFIYTGLDIQAFVCTEILPSDYAVNRSHQHARKHTHTRNRRGIFERERKKENLKYEFQFRFFLIHAAVDVSLNSTRLRTERDVHSTRGKSLTGVFVLETQQKR